MRVLTKNSGIITATVALLMLTAMLITGCAGDITVEKPYSPPPGMGAVKLNFNKTIARTILPDGVDGPEDFDHFDLHFTKSGTGALTPITVDQGDEGDPVPLDFGSYSLQVLAFLNAGDLEEAASWDSENGAATYSIIISDSTPVPVNVQLRGNVTTGTGTFAWEIRKNSIYGDVEIVDMTIAKIGGSTTVYDLLKGLGSGTSSGSDDKGLIDSLSLASGYYIVTFKVSVDSTVINFRQILHIYANMTSSFEYEFTNEYFGIVSGFIEMTITYANRGTVILLEDDDNTPIEEKDTVGPLEIGSDSVVITFTNASEFTGITWNCSDASMSLAVSSAGGQTNATLTITPTSTVGHFEKAKTYIITVTGTNDAGEPSSLFFYVEVVDP